MVDKFRRKIYREKTFFLISLGSVLKNDSVKAKQTKTKCLIFFFGSDQTNQEELTKFEHSKCLEKSDMSHKREAGRFHWKIE